jgi:hypothetical protein
MFLRSLSATTHETGKFRQCSKLPGSTRGLQLCTKSRKFMDESKNGVTLKALANVSPGFALKPWVQKCPSSLFATLKGLRGFAVNKRRRNSFRVAPSRNQSVFPGLPERNPGLELANAFSVIQFLTSLSKLGGISTFCAKPRPAFGFCCSWCAVEFS